MCCHFYFRNKETRQTTQKKKSISIFFTLEFSDQTSDQHESLYCITTSFSPIINYGVKSVNQQFEILRQSIS